MNNRITEAKTVTGSKEREAAALYNLFDLHCDTIEELRKNGEDFLHCTTQFQIKDQDKFEKAVQCLAVFVPDTIRGEKAVSFVDGYHTYMGEQVAKISSRAALIEQTSDMDAIFAAHKWAFMRTIESGAALGGILDNVDHFAKLNFKMMGLVWNGQNELGSGPRNDTGLTEFGKQVVKRMEQVGMIVDCSHLNDAGFDDLLEIAERPFVASHSNVRACCHHPRNLTDRQFKEIVRRGGLCGVNLFSLFCEEPDDGGEKQKEAILRHVYHMLELGGEDVIAWGTDFDGEITCNPDLVSPIGIARYGAYLTAHGIPEEAVRKMSFENAYRFFQKWTK